MKLYPFSTWSDAILERAITCAQRDNRTDSDFYRDMIAELNRRFHQAQAWAKDNL